MIPNRQAAYIQDSWSTSNSTELDMFLCVGQIVAVRGFLNKHAHWLLRIYSCQNKFWHHFVYTAHNHNLHYPNSKVGNTNQNSEATKLCMDGIFLSWMLKKLTIKINYTLFSPYMNKFTLTDFTTQSLYYHPSQVVPNYWLVRHWRLGE